MRLRRHLLVLHGLDLFLLAIAKLVHFDCVLGHLHRFYPPEGVCGVDEGEDRRAKDEVVCIVGLKELGGVDKAVTTNNGRTYVSSLLT